MVVGLGPEYNYDASDHAGWSSNNTRYASNHGASLISRTLIDYFDADYVDDLDHPEYFRDEYDLCVLAFATHITTWRDVSPYTQFVEKLGIKTVAFSLGMQDSDRSLGHLTRLHPSMDRLLRYVLDSSGRIGVRGPYTATALKKAGLPGHQIVNLGCPTLFATLRRELRISKPARCDNPLIVYHGALADLNAKLLSGAPLLGQDFLDEVLFKADTPPDNPQIAAQREQYSARKNGALAIRLIRERGIFPESFKDWHDTIGRHDFIVGARLHGNIAALIRGIPAFMLARDLRVREIAEMFELPFLPLDEVGEAGIEDLFERADYSGFNRIYPRRFDNFIKLMSDLGLLSRLRGDGNFTVPENYFVSEHERRVMEELPLREIARLQESLGEVTVALDRIQRLHRKMRGVPVLGRLYRYLTR